MHNEEKLIKGIWMWRNTPEGEWIMMDSVKLHSKINDLENTIGAIRNHLENCHTSFRNREHGGVAEQKLRHGVQDVLQMPYSS